MNNQMLQSNPQGNGRDRNLQAVIAGLAGDLTQDNPLQRSAVEQALAAMLGAADGIKALAGQEPPTVVIEVRGGLVQDVHCLGDSAGPIKVIVRDHDNRAVDPKAEDAQWLLGSESGHA